MDELELVDGLKKLSDESLRDLYTVLHVQLCIFTDAKCKEAHSTVETFGAVEDEIVRRFVDKEF